MAWNASKPATDERLANVPTVITDNWKAIENAETGFIPAALNLTQQGSDPTNIASAGILYTKATGGQAELFYEDDSGNVAQLTRTSELSVAANGKTFLPGGLVLFWFTASLGAGTSVTLTYPSSLTFGTATYSIILSPIQASAYSGSLALSSFTTTGCTVSKSNAAVDVSGIAIGI